jgi:hypothetical protein
MPTSSSSSVEDIEAEIERDYTYATDAELDAVEQELEGELRKEAAPKLTADDLRKRRTSETDLVANFQKHKSTETFMPLYNSFKPWIAKATHGNSFGSPFPPAAHNALAAQSFLDAIRTWNPNKGVQFRTHVWNTVQNKGKRLNLKYQNIGYIPEARATKYQAFQTALHLLREELGREPSTIELSDELAIAPADVERLRKEIRQDRIMKEDMPTLGPSHAQSDRVVEAARDIQYALIPKHRLVLEHIQPIAGKPLLVKQSGGPDVLAIAKATKLSVGEVRSALKTISRKVQEHMGTAGAAKIEHVFGESEG